MFSSNDIKKIRFTSLIEIDKIYNQKYTGTFTGVASPSPGEFRITTSTIAQPEGVRVFPIMQWSVNNSDWYDGGNSQWNASVYPTIDYSANCYTTSTNLVIVFGNATGSAVTCYYRVFLVSED